MSLLLGLAVVGCARNAAWDGLRTEVRRHEARADSLGKLVRGADTVYVHQRDTLLRDIAVVDTLTVTVERWKRDTLQVVRYVARADSALRACVSTMSACEERVRLRDAQHAAEKDAQRVQMAAMKAQIPTRRQRLTTMLTYLGLGALLGLGVLGFLKLRG